MVGTGIVVQDVVLSVRAAYLGAHTRVCLHGRAPARAGLDAR